MIRRLLCALAALSLAMLPARAAPEDHLVRLHVVAHSNSAADQQFKLEIRDAVLSQAQRLLAHCKDADEAYETVQAHLPDFLKAAQDRAEALGSDASITAETGVFPFPERTYGNITVPAGEYRALRIVIGEGKGENWWCVLFPNLCLPAEGEYHSILAEWLNNLFGGENS